MSLSITQEMKQTFNLVALRGETDVLLTGRQWEKRNALVKRCAADRDKANALFNERYETRIMNEQKRLMNEAGSKTQAYKPNWAQDDVFDKSALLSQADDNVRNAHQNRITQIDQFEKRGLATLLQTSARENRIQCKAQQAFSTKTERRSGERRVRQSPRQQR